MEDLVAAPSAEDVRVWEAHSGNADVTEAAEDAHAAMNSEAPSGNADVTEAEEGADAAMNLEAHSGNAVVTEAAECAHAAMNSEAEEEKHEAAEVSVVKGVRVKIRARRSRSGSVTSTPATSIHMDTTVYSARSHKQHTGYEVRAHTSGSLSALDRTGDAFLDELTTLYADVDASEGPWEVMMQSRPQPLSQLSWGAPASPLPRPFSSCSAYVSQSSPRQGPSSRPMSAPSARTSVWSHGRIGRMPPSRMGKSGGWYGVVKARTMRLHEGGYLALPAMHHHGGLPQDGSCCY